MNNKSFFLPSNTIHTAISGFIPTGICWAICRFDVAHFSSALFEENKIEFPSVIQNSVDKRQAEFLAGRVLARRLLEPNESQVTIGSNRAPEWPSGVVGSITHTDTLALVMLNRSGQYQAIGCDIESMISTSLMTDIKFTIVQEGEIEALSTGNLTEEELFTIIFSAKESLYKALYPSVNYFFDFHTASITRLNFDEKSVTLVLNTTLNKDYQKRDLFNISYHLVDQHVITYLALSKHQ